MKLRAAALALLILSCTQQGVGQTQTTPSTSVSPMPETSPDGKPLGSDLPVTPVDFSCRLPVTKFRGGGDYAQYAGAFVDFPSTAYSYDPKGVIHSRYLEQDFETNATPVLYGTAQDGPPIFDLAQHRWLPVSSAQSSADGSSYAYSYAELRSAQMKVRIVDVPTATEKVFDVSQPERAQVVDFGPAGVYLLLPSALGGPGEGVWLLNATSGAIKRLRVVLQVMAVRDGYAWVGRIDPRNPPPTPYEGTVANSLVRVDLKTGAETTWYYHPGAPIWLVEQPGTAGVQVCR